MTGDGNEIFQSRMKGVGTYTAEEALQYSLSGPNLRCTGVEWDLRKNEPYSVYDRFDFDIVTEQSGDVWARYLVRTREIEQSLRIIEQAIEQMPKDGPIMAKFRGSSNRPKGKFTFKLSHPKAKSAVTSTAKAKTNLTG